MIVIDYYHELYPAVDSHLINAHFKMPSPRYTDKEFKTSVEIYAHEHGIGLTEMSGSYCFNTEDDLIKFLMLL